MSVQVDYSGDDYPRAGCRLVIDVARDGYALSVYSPAGRKLEHYRPAQTAGEIARMVERWAGGEPALPVGVRQPGRSGS